MISEQNWFGALLLVRVADDSLGIGRPREGFCSGVAWTKAYCPSLKSRFPTPFDKANSLGAHQSRSGFRHFIRSREVVEPRLIIPAGPKLAALGSPSHRHPDLQHSQPESKCDHDFWTTVPAELVATRRRPRRGKSRTDHHLFGGAVLFGMICQTFRHLLSECLCELRSVSAPAVKGHFGLDLAGFK